MTNTVTVHLRFAADTVLGTYQDTLIFTEDEWAKRDQKAIDAAKQTLADTWVAFRGPQIAEEASLKTLQGKIDKIAEIDAKIADLNAVKAAINGS